MNISHVCEEYISAKSRKCRQNTLDGYISALRCHVLPKWGGRAIWLSNQTTPKQLGLPGEWKSFRWCLATSVGSVIEPKDKIIDRNGVPIQLGGYNNSDNQKWHAFAEGVGTVRLWIGVA